MCGRRTGRGWLKRRRTLASWRQRSRLLKTPHSKARGAVQPVLGRGLRQTRGHALEARSFLETNLMERKTPPELRVEFSCFYPKCQVLSRKSSIDVYFFLISGTSSSSSGSTQTMKNPDGSTTTIVIKKQAGTVTKTAEVVLFCRHLFILGNSL